MLSYARSSTDIIPEHLTLTFSLDNDTEFSRSILPGSLSVTGLLLRFAYPEHAGTADRCVTSPPPQGHSRGLPIQ